MTISTARRTDRAQTPGTLITVALGPTARSSLGQLQEITGLSQADLANCALTWYAYFDTQLRAGYSLTLWKAGTAAAGKAYTLTLPAGSPATGGAPVGSALRIGASRLPWAGSPSRPGWQSARVFTPARPWLAGASSRGSPSATLR